MSDTNLRLKNLILSCGLAILLGSFATAPSWAAPPTPPLSFDNYQQAIAEARKQDLPVVLHFYTTWCSPCKMMDQTVFSSPKLEQALAGKVILVKVDAEKSADLASMYVVTSYPRDVFIDPQGRVLSTVTGPASLDIYIQNALQVESRYRKSQELQQARNNSGNSIPTYSKMEIRLGLSAPFPEELMSTRPLVVDPQTEAAPATPNVPTPQEEAKPKVVFVALDGHCPVRLARDRNWVEGKEEWDVEYQQQRYRMAGKAEREEFLKHPDQYAPRLLGCDPVIMWESDRAIPGSTAYAAYWNEELFLFTNEQNREIFRIDPARYLNTQHVLQPEHVEATIIR